MADTNVCPTVKSPAFFRRTVRMNDLVAQTFLSVSLHCNPSETQTGMSVPPIRNPIRVATVDDVYL